MFRKTALSLTIIFIFLSMISARSSAGDNTYYNSANHYTLTVPDGWEEIPKAIIDKGVSNAMSQFSDKSDFVGFDTGFHLKNKYYSEYPYILIQNYEINARSYNQIEKDLAGNEILDEFEKTKREYENILSNASAKKPYLDKVRNMVFMNMEMDVQGVGKVKNLITICLGRERVIRIFFYSPESEYLQNLPIFMSILDSFKYDQGYEYSESKAENNYSKGIWDGVLEKGIIGAIFGALISILFVSRVFIKSRNKKGKNQNHPFFSREEKIESIKIKPKEEENKKRQEEIKKVEQIYNSLDPLQKEEIKIEVENRLPDFWKVQLNKVRVKGKTLKMLEATREEKKREIIKEWISSGRIRNINSNVSSDKEDIFYPEGKE